MSRIFALFLMPPICNLIIFIFGFIFWYRRPKLARIFMLFGFLLLLGFSTPIMPKLLLKHLEQKYPALSWQSNIQQADAIVVLGAGRYLNAPEYSHDSIQGHALERVRYAAYVYRHTKLPILIAGGRPGGGENSEAKLMKDSLESEFQVPVQWIEDRSVNSIDNARRSAEILLPLKKQKIYLVTHAFHMARAKMSFEKAGFSVVPAPMGYIALLDAQEDWGDRWFPSLDGLVYSHILMHEMIGLLWYSLRFN